MVKGDLATEMRKPKNEPGTDTAILANGSLISQLAQEGLIDEYELAAHQFNAPMVGPWARRDGRAEKHGHAYCIQPRFRC